MKCKEFKKLLSYEIDGLISQQERISLQDHLSQCSGCVQERKELAASCQLLKASLTEMTVPELSPDFDAEFYRKLNEPAKRFFWLPSLTIVPKRMWLELSIMVLLLFGLKMIPEIIPSTQQKEQGVASHNSFIEIAVKQTQDMQINQLSDEKAKEVLQNFI